MIDAEGVIRTCEFCDKPGNQMAPDELGNDCWVCDEHAEMLATNAKVHDETLEDLQPQKGVLH